MDESTAGRGDLTECGYRKSHTVAGYGQRYSKTYTRGYYAAQWKEIEEPILRGLLEKYVAGRGFSCIDFACGTGRITSVVSAYCRSVTGVDVSQEMLSAAVVPGNVTLANLDLTRSDLGEQFALATAFRFFLNAEDQLRREALAAISRHLLDDGLLICNIHMVASSPMGVIYRLGRRLLGWTTHNTMGESEFLALLKEAGFVPLEVVHYGYLPRPGRLLPDLCERLVNPVERLAKKLRFPSALAQSFIVVSRKIQ